MRSLKSIQKGLISKNYQSETLSENDITIQSVKNPKDKKFSGVVNKYGSSLAITVIESNYSPKYLRQKLARDVGNLVPGFSTANLQLLNIGPGSVVTVLSQGSAPSTRQFNKTDRFYDYGTGLISCNGWAFGNIFRGTLQGSVFNSACIGGTNQKSYAKYQLS